uniref:Testis expressed 14, intercellular bridge forming factor n=1 Tax=Calidris pygmaea TaxID=425635 RepID=A0A8C3JLP1_9CHAR
MGLGGTCSGISVDAVNSMGQTSLFTAALLGLRKIVDVLLDYGSDANHRCYDGSTPVHAAAFSGNQWVLSKLLDEGGDLRVHDKSGKSPQCWAMSAGKESSAQMLEFIQRCTSHMQAVIQNFPSDLLKKVGSSNALVCSPSRFGGLVQGNVDSPLRRLLKGGANTAKNIYSFGFGKFYLAGSGHLGYLASLPIVGEKDVVQADDEPAFSYHVGPYMMMTNLMWEGSRVTVKELSFEPHQNCSKLRLADLLVAEQERSSQLRHPHLLQLMSVCLSSDLEKTRLVYERVNFGSLYSILHERRTEFPVLHMETILHVLLQINDALRFLHSRGFIHRSVTSYAIQIVSSGEAKLCNLEYMIESKDGGEHSDLTRIPVPVQLYKWCSPEVILEKAVTVKSDVYSFCTVVQEALTETLPWKGFEDSVIKQLIISGQQLEADVRLPMPYYGVVKSGLEPKQRNRFMKLQDIQYIMKNDLKVTSRIVALHIFKMGVLSFSYQKRTQEVQREEITEAGEILLARCHVSFTYLQPVAQDKNHDVASEPQTTFSASDVDDSLCSFENNEIFASFPECHKDLMEEEAGLCQTVKDEKLQQKEEARGALGDLYASPGVPCEEKPLYEEDGFSELGIEYTTEEERVSEASDLCVLAQARGDAGKRMCSPSQEEQYIGKCVLDLKIVQSMLHEAEDSLRRAEEKLGKIDQTFNFFSWEAIGPPSRVYIPPLITCQAQEALGGDSFQAVSKTAKEMEAIQDEKSKCFHEMSESKNENSCHDLCFSEVKSLDDQMTEVKRMARRVASGHLELGSACAASECTSESEAESIREAFQHVTLRVQKGQDQQRCGWPTGDNVESWGLGSEDGSESEESDLDARSGYSNCQNIFPHFRSVTDIQDLSSIPCEQEDYSGDIDCKTPRVSHAPTSVSTPLRSGNGRGKKGGPVNYLTFLCQESDLSTFFFFFPISALSQASNCFIDELPPPARELLDEIGKRHFTQSGTRLASCLQSGFLPNQSLLKYTRASKLVAVRSMIRKLGINSLNNWQFFKLVLEVSAFHGMVSC